ncbi:hypothetical protein SOVF_151030 [Spinacia oleracea]|nr:hypothetical protein SOVF_151030 [Spinacia oleracea]
MVIVCFKIGQEFDNRVHCFDLSGNEMNGTWAFVLVGLKVSSMLSATLLSTLAYTPNSSLSFTTSRSTNLPLLHRHITDNIPAPSSLPRNSNNHRAILKTKKNSKQAAPASPPHHQHSIFTIIAPTPNATKISLKSQARSRAKSRVFMFGRT